MKALILKDIYCITKQYASFLLIATLMSISGNSFMVMLVVFYGVAISISSLDTDEKSKWSKLASMMPYKKSDIILSKYILTYIGIFAFLIISLTVNFLTYTFNLTETFDLEIYALSLSFGLIYGAISLFTMFVFGVAKSRLVIGLVGIIIVVFGILGSGASFLPEQNYLIMLSPQIMLGIGVLINIITIYVQIKFIKINAD